MDHPDWPAFVAAIVADPADDTARLVAADFLQENGDADRAGFIRLQVALGVLEAGGEGKSLAADELRKKERAYLGPLSVYRTLWAAEACPELVTMNFRGGGRDPLEAMAVDGADRLTWRRGFVEAVRCTAVQWRHHGAALRSRQPIREVVLTEHRGLDAGRWLAMMPTFAGLTRVGLSEDGRVEPDAWPYPLLRGHAPPGVAIGPHPH